MKRKMVSMLTASKASSVSPVSMPSFARIDLSENNDLLTEAQFADTNAFSDYLNKLRLEKKVDYLVGGYDELRKVYGRSALFSGAAEGDNQEPRRLHIGVDIWGKAGTDVLAPLDGIVHSFANNAQFGDYGPTIILQHEAGSQRFHTLYGHLALRDLDGLVEGRRISKGDVIAHFGEDIENGHWPPHLHFQVIISMQNYKGDYPGVCRYSERDYYLENCPDPELLVKFQ